MGAHLPAAATSVSAEIFAEAAERIRRSVRRGVGDAPDAIAALIVDTLERTSGVRVRDRTHLARQLLLWHRTYPPDQARELTVAALADRANALRRSVSRRRRECGAGE